jgi:uncharacterized Fe-S radical SAM superfamily protein PflX
MINYWKIVPKVENFSGGNITCIHFRNHDISQHMALVLMHSETTIVQKVSFTTKSYISI